MEGLLDLGGRVPRHLHLRQDERVEVLGGSPSIQLGENHGLTKGEKGRGALAHPASVSNTHQGHARFLLQVRPARRMETAMRAVLAVAE